MTSIGKLDDGQQSGGTFYSARVLRTSLPRQLYGTLPITLHWGNTDHLGLAQLEMDTRQTWTI